MSDRRETELPCKASPSILGQISQGKKKGGTILVSVQYLFMADLTMSEFWWRNDGNYIQI